MVLESLIGGVLGGVARLAPEVLRIFDRKNERAHELSMQDKQFQFQKLAIEAKAVESQAAIGIEEMKTFAEAIKSQGQMVGNVFVDAMNSLVRPLVTYFVFLLYAFVKIAAIASASNGGASFLDAVTLIWTDVDMGMLTGILNFWFVGRVFDKNKL